MPRNSLRVLTIGTAAAVAMLCGPAAQARDTVIVIGAPAVFGSPYPLPFGDRPLPRHDGYALGFRPRHREYCPRAVVVPPGYYPSDYGSYRYAYPYRGGVYGAYDGWRDGRDYDDDNYNRPRGFISFGTRF